MVDINYVNGLIAKSHIKLTALAQAMGFSRQTLYSKMKGEVEFKPPEIDKLCIILRLTDEEKSHIYTT